MNETVVGNNSKVGGGISTIKLSVINGLRGFALLMVIFHHLPIHAWCLTHFPYFFNNTYTGVNLFFILSGFVLYRHYLLHHIPFLSWSETWEFYKKRFFRLYPLFFLNCLVLFLFFHAGEKEYFWSSVKALSTYSLFLGHDVLPKINWVLWSLMLEVWFSILFPVLLLLIYKFQLLASSLFILSFALLSRVVSVAWPDTGTPLLLLARLDDFFVGFVICYFFYQNHKMWKEYALHLFIFSWIVLLIACLYNDHSISYFVVLNNTFFQLGYGALLLSLLLIEGWPSKLFSLWPLQVLGMMCFSIYVWHGVLILIIIRKDFFAIDYLYYVIAVLSISIISYRYIEFRKESSVRKLFLL